MIIFYVGDMSYIHLNCTHERRPVSVFSVKEQPSCSVIFFSCEQSIQRKIESSVYVAILEGCGLYYFEYHIESQNLG